MTTRFEERHACEFLVEARNLISKSANESSLRHNISAYLPRIFSEMPWWVKEHSNRAETKATFHKSGKESRGFVDALVGATAIEYEKDISNSIIFNTGYGQVADYCADLINKGVSQDLIIGVLSDTVRWKAYVIAELKPLSAIPGSKIYGRDHLILHEIDECDFSAVAASEAKQLEIFLKKHLGRLGARRLNANTLSSDLGFDSAFSKKHYVEISSLVESAFSSNPIYAGLIEKLWQDFVAYLGGGSKAGEFDRGTYVGELYILTLAKLICANIISGKALSSDNDELKSILDGAFFQNRGLSNLVEYDYFGWLNADPHAQELFPTARAIQDDLIAYDFSSTPTEDLFGALMAQLARRSQRILLGQEWTPSWLAEKLVKRTLDNIPSEMDLRLVDMCCGSGAMVVEVVKEAKIRLLAEGAIVGSSEALTKLTDAITGFDVDPLAVMLAKISWVLAAREWLNPAAPASIPVYHADSLFAATPLTKEVYESGNLHHEMLLDDKKVSLPAYLISPENRPLFDIILEKIYSVAMASADSEESEITDPIVKSILLESISSSKCVLGEEEIRLLEEFTLSLILALEDLQRSGRNGIWAFVMRNSYRPGLVTGKFNGLVSNPPWLALSKIASNPYTKALRDKAEAYSIKPPGPAHLHVEMATIFLLHAVEKYLISNSVVGCVLPESIMSAHHHNPFRAASYATASRPVKLHVDEIWRVEKGTFKNEAVVMFGTKTEPVTGDILGQEISKDSTKAITFKRIVMGNRTAWSDNVALGSSTSGVFNPATFRQGADIMPRTLIFHSLEKVSSNGPWNVRPIAVDSEEAYLTKSAKNNKGFSMTVSGLSNDVVFHVLLSHHLTPFDIGTGAKGILPIVRDDEGRWRALSNTEIALKGLPTVNAFKTINKELGPHSTNQSQFEYFETDRKKLTNQLWDGKWLVFMGAGGTNVCAAFASTSEFNQEKTVIDQTLYWTGVDSEDEAVYLTGLLNSEAINDVIKEFQPRGQFGERHVHKLPLGVTPPFDPDDPSHAEVVLKTNQLLLEWNAYKISNDKIVGDLLNPNKSVLHVRRPKIHRLLTTLSSWQDYENACKAVYCVS